MVISPSNDMTLGSFPFSIRRVRYEHAGHLNSFVCCLLRTPELFPHKIHLGFSLGFSSRFVFSSVCVCIATCEPYNARGHLELRPEATGDQPTAGPKPQYYTDRSHRLLHERGTWNNMDICHALFCFPNCSSTLTVRPLVCEMGSNPSHE